MALALIASLPSSRGFCCLKTGERNKKKRKREGGKINKKELGVPIFLLRTWAKERRVCVRNKGTEIETYCSCLRSGEIMCSETLNQLSSNP